MKKLQELTPQEVESISRQVADAFYDYKYNEEDQGQGFMRNMLEQVYKVAEKRKVPVILDTDDKDKCERYMHLGMKLDRVRNCGERFHMYDLIREA